MVVGLAERHGLHDGALRRVVALDQEHPFGQRVHAMCARQEVDPGHPAEVVIDDEQRHRLARVRQPAQRGEPRGGRRFTDDVEVLAEPPAEIILERVQHPGVVVDHEKNGP